MPNTDIKTLLEQLALLGQRLKDAELCLRTLLEPSMYMPKQSVVKPAATSFPGKVDIRGKIYKISPDQGAWLRAQYASGVTIKELAQMAGIGTAGMRSFLTKLGVKVVRGRPRSVRPSTSPRTATDVVWGIIQTHHARGRLARTDVAKWARRERLNPYQVGQCLRILQERKHITVSGDLICVAPSNPSKP